MRKELELMDTIEKYINGSLSEADKVAFEKKLAASPELQKELEVQQQLMKGIERTGLKQSIKKASKKYTLNRNLRNWGLSGLTVAIITAGALLIYNSVTKNNVNENAPNILPELNEQGTKLWSDADKYLPLQSFELNAEKDTVVETTDGIVIAIPANSFLDANGNPAKGTIALEVKEALNAADVMKAGLNTKSGDKLLETGGMFYINARKDGKSLNIDPENPLYAEIPSEETKPGMQLFEGKRLPDGTLDWINPKPIEKNLLPVDILSLNFYPPDYLGALSSWGYNAKDRKFTDSLYYSFASHFLSKEAITEAFQNDTLRDVSTASLSSQPGDAVALRGEELFNRNCAVCHSMGTNKITGPGMSGLFTRVPSDEWVHKFIKNNDALIKSGDAYAVKISQYDASAMTVFSYMSDDDIDAIIRYIKYGNSIDGSDYINGINPAKIKAIWNEKFQNTLLATREFEERLSYIHRVCNDRGSNEQILDLYVNNLDKNLSAIDSMAAELGAGAAFAKFALRGDGKVKNGNRDVRLLKDYYERRAKMYTEQLTKAVREFWDDQSEKDKEAFRKRNENKLNEAERVSDNFKKEVELNLSEAYRQLGQKRPKPSPGAPYGVHVATTGWYNVDAFVIESVANRTTLDYIDPASKKRAEIKYQPLNISISDARKYDRVLVYLLPDELNSFMRVKGANGVFKEELNELMIYKMVCIAYKGEESFYFSQDNIKPGTTTVSLIKTTNEDIRTNVNRYTGKSQVKAMNDELNFIAFEKQEQKRQQKLSRIRELTEKVKPVIFPCMAAVPAKPDSSKSAMTESELSE